MGKNRVAILTVTAVLVFPLDLAGEGQTPCAHEDRAAIEALMWRYLRALDTLDADAYARTYVEDGRFGSGENAVVGRPALRGMIADMLASRSEGIAGGADPVPPMYHMITSAQLECTGKDRARYQYYWMTVFAAPGVETPPRVAAAGRGIDDLVRVQGEWLIVSRDVAPHD